jgi:4-carboxymuconolactone decarboxylase
MLPPKPRIDPVQRATAEQHELFRSVVEKWGYLPNLFATLGHHPLVLPRVRLLGNTFITNGSLPPRERELVILRVAAQTSCAYEWSHHTISGRRYGIDDIELDWLLHRLDDPNSAWGATDRALLNFTDQLIASTTVSDSAWDAVAAAYRQPDLMIELVMLIGFYRLLAGFLRTIRVERDPGLPEPPAGSDWL